jgi:hypothetical protein
VDNVKIYYMHAEHNMKRSLLRCKRRRCFQGLTIVHRFPIFHHGWQDQQNRAATVRTCHDTPHGCSLRGVTENGVANLKGLSSTERARALIGLAHPAFQDKLTAAAKEQHLI